MNRTQHNRILNIYLVNFHQGNKILLEQKKMVQLYSTLLNLQPKTHN